MRISGLGNGIVSTVNNEDARSSFALNQDDVRAAGAAVIKKQAESLGRSFLSDPNKESYDKYRNAIGDLLKEILNDGYEATSYIGYDLKGNPRVRHILKKIDEKVDEIYKTIIASHYESILLMSLVDNITGLLVSLVA